VCVRVAHRPQFSVRADLPPAAPWIMLFLDS